jgi:hypothetical protein
MRIYTDLRADPFKMQPRLSKVKGYIRDTMPLLFSFAFIFKEEPKGLGFSAASEKGREFFFLAFQLVCILVALAGGGLWSGWDSGLRLSYE